MRRMTRVVLTLGLVIGLPTAALAQASIAGIVRDASGGVLPGVTIEATSPVLIEKVRTTISDGTGRYTVADLRPGTYRVTFTLPGFTTVIREDVVLTGSAVTTVDASMQVGALQETITVSGATPIVDLQSTTRQAVLDQELVSAIPSSRTPFTVGRLIPGVQTGFGGQDVGGSVVQEVASLVANGGRTSDQRMMVNGVALSSGIAGGWGGGAVPNASGTAEFAIDVSGVDATAATGGVRVNFIPRDGGNSFSGTVFASYADEGFASDNYTGTDVEAAGLQTPNTIKRNGDFNPGFGGPILRDKLWFFLSGRYIYAENYVAGMFFNRNVNDPNNFRWESNGQQAFNHQDQKIYQMRFTWQASPRNKFGVTMDYEDYCGCPNDLSSTQSPEAGTDRRFPVQRFVSADWSSPVNNNLLLELSAIHRVERWGNMHLQTGKGGNVEAITPGIVSINDNPSLATGGPLEYRADPDYNNSWNWNIHYRAALSYITGSHNFKVGFNNAYLHYENSTYTDPVPPYSYNFANGNPNSITYRLTPRTVSANVDRDMGLFVQDKWTTGRLSLSGGLRFDHFKNSFPEQGISGTFFGRVLDVQYPRIENLNWKDVTPKLGATYDVFGDGRTALKVTLNKYLEGLGTTGFGAAQVTDAPNPINRLETQTTRTWTDNGDFIPQCDLNDFGVSGECGALNNAAIFGTVTPGTAYDPDLLEGWGKRANNWEFTLGVQHEIVPRVSVDLQYARRWYGNVRVTDDLAVGAADYERFTFTTPVDPALPGGGGQTLTGFTLTPAAIATSTQYFVTASENFGAMTEHYDGVTTQVNARLANGLLVQGGFSTGRVVTNDCAVVDALPEMLHTFFGNPTRTFVFAARPLERCEQNNGFRTNVQGLASYTIPRIDVQISGTVQNLAGDALSANYNLPAAATTLGHGFSEGFFRAYNIVQAGEVYEERVNQIDLRLAKIFRVAENRISVNFDFYNVLNSNTVLTENASYGVSWRRPTSILLPRLFKLSAQLDF